MATLEENIAVMDTGKEVQTDEDSDSYILEILAERSGPYRAEKEVSVRKKKKHMKKKNKVIVPSE